MSEPARADQPLEVREREEVVEPSWLLPRDGERLALVDAVEELLCPDGF
jgi:hypothetical protein